MTDVDTSPHDHLNWHVDVRVDKWHKTEDYEAGKPPDDFTTSKGNGLCNAGITRLINLLTGAGGQAFDVTHSRILVGDSATAFAASQTDMQAASNRYYKLVTSVTPAAQTITWVAAFGSAQANFAWAEWGIDAGTADSATTVTAPLLNRKVESLGTKASGATWTFTVAITIS